MAHAIPNGFQPLRALGHFLGSVGASIWAGLILMAEARPQMEKLHKLSQLSDEDLAARGMTRVQALDQILGKRCL